MSKHTSIQVTNPGLFSAGDMHDAHELAACDMCWMSSALDHINSALNNMVNAHANSGHILLAELKRLITHIEMYRYLADDRYLDHLQTAERFKEQLEGRGEHHG